MENQKSKGGIARAKSLTAKERSEIARKAAESRWHESNPLAQEELLTVSETMPKARWRGNLNIIGVNVPCYVLDNELRVIGRTSATELLTGIKGGGALEKYIGVKSLEPFINKDLVLEKMIPFRLEDVEGLNTAVKGLPADLFIDLCQSFVRALDSSLHSDSSIKMTPRQQQMAIKAGMFLSACAKVGLDALIDEATGYQEERAENALQVKLSLFLEEEMRKWEKTFPDELWKEFGRLTGWSGPVRLKPKYWGKLVMQLIYEKLDPDIAKWLKENAPAPKTGQNYHQWLSSQYGLKKLTEHIWMIIGIAKSCHNITELKDKVEALYGKHPVQLRFYFPPYKS